MKKKIIIISGVVILIAIIGFIIFLKNTGIKSKEVLPEVRVSTLDTSEMISNIETEGTVVFKVQDSIYAESTDQIKTVNVNEGDSVSPGDTILTYSQSSLKTLQDQLKEAQLSLKHAKLSLESLQMPSDDSQIKQVEVQVVQAENSVKDIESSIKKLNDDISKANTDFENIKILYNQGAVSLSEFQSAESNLKNLQIQLQTTKGNLEVAKQQLEASKAQYNSVTNKELDRSSQNRIESQKILVEQANLKVNQINNEINKLQSGVKANVKGNITKIYVKQGETINEGKLLLEIGQQDSLLIQAYINEYDMEQIKLGQKVEIKTGYTDEILEGTISYISSVAEKINSGTGEKNVVKIEVSVNDKSVLKAGYTVKLNIITNIEKDAITIPVTSYITQTDAEPFVYLVNTESILEKRPIKLKSFKGALVSVEGLKKGEIIVSNPSDYLQEGMKVEPISDMPLS